MKNNLSGHTLVKTNNITSSEAVVTNPHWLQALVVHCLTDRADTLYPYTSNSKRFHIDSRFQKNAQNETLYQRFVRWCRRLLRYFRKQIVATLLNNKA